jgi:hypothetical protein
MLQVAVGVNNPNPSNTALGRELDVLLVHRPACYTCTGMRATATYTTIVIAYRRRSTLRLIGSSHQTE